MSILNIFQLQWLLEDFLGYFKEWEQDAEAAATSKNKKKKRCVSRQTLQGIEFTGIFY